MTQRKTGYRERSITVSLGKLTQYTTTQGMYLATYLNLGTCYKQLRLSFNADFIQSSMKQAMSYFHDFGKMQAGRKARRRIPT